MRHPFFIHSRSIERHVEARLGFRGRFSVELIHARTGLVKRRLHFKNVITDIGLQQLVNGNHSLPNMNAIAVGTGSTTPAATDTALESELVVSTSSGGFGESRQNPNSGNGYTLRRTFTRLFTEGQANGNLTEVGVKFGSSGELWSRQLFTDDLGAPTTIVKTDQDQLKINYTWEMPVPITENDHPVNIPTPDAPGGVATTVTTRALEADSDREWGWSTASFTGPFAHNFGEWWLGTRGEVHAFETDVLPGVEGSAGNGSEAASFGVLAYAGGGAPYRDVRAIFQAPQANFGTGIGTVSFFFGFRWPAELFVARFAPKVEKSNLDRFILDLRVTVGRAP